MSFTLVIRTARLSYDRSSILLRSLPKPLRNTQTTATKLCQRPFNSITASRPPLRNVKILPRIYSQSKCQPRRLAHSSGELDLKEGRFLVGTILATCVSVFGWHYMTEDEYRKTGSKTARDSLNSFNRNMVLSLQNIKEGRYYTLLTSAFTHTTPFHLAANMLALWSFGPTTILFHGIPKFVVLYVGSAIAGSLAQVWYWQKYSSPGARQQRGYGASGALFGVFSAFACTMPRYPVAILFIPISFPIGVAAVAAVGFSLGALKEGWAPQLAHSAHLGGMAFGVVFWALALRRGRVLQIKYRS